MAAWDEIMNELGPGETLEALVFGRFGWGGGDDDSTPDYGEPVPFPIPRDKQGIVFPAAAAKELMQRWDIAGGYGSPTCYALYAWTDRRVIWITQYDGRTWLCSAPRHPEPCKPTIPGG